MTLPRILHVIATGERRGGPIFATDLVGWLASAGADQRVAVLRATDEPEMEFDAPVHLLGRDDIRIPGLRISATNLVALRRLIKHWKPNIVQAHGGEALKYALSTTVLNGPPVVYRRIGGSPGWITEGSQRWAHGVLARRATKVVAVAEALREETIRLFDVPHESIITIPNGVDGARMVSMRGRQATRDALGIDRDALVVLSLGGLTWEKDPLAHIDIGQRVLHDRDDAVHLVVGDGPMRPDVECEVQEQGLGSRALVLGARSDAPDLMAASDVLLFASRSDGMEGMPAIVIEAGMMGLPTVAYAIAGVPEVVADGRTGFLVPEGDREVMTERILRLLADGCLREAMGEEARERCTKQFDISVVAPSYLELYRELVATR